MTKGPRKPRSGVRPAPAPKLSEAVSIPSLPAPVPSFQSSQDRERKMSRSYWTLAQCNRALVRATSEKELLTQVCKLLVQVGEYQMAWVGFAMDDAERTVRCVARGGFSDGYLESIRVNWGDGPHGGGPTGTCIRTGKPVVNRNSETEPTFAPWREQAMERGFASSIALPLGLAGRPLGALMVYSSRLDAFDDEEEELLLRLAEDLAYGVGALRDRDERERAEARLHEREALYRQIVQNFPNGALGLYDHALRYLLIDGEGLQSIGQSSSSLEGRSNREVFPPDLADLLDPPYRAALQGTPVHLDVPLAGRWFDVNLRPMRDAGGNVAMGFVSSVDITERKLAEEQLRHAQKMEAVGLLAGGIAHDFNNLLTVMLTSSTLALEDAPWGSSMRGDIEECRAAAEKARAVTQQLLTFSRHQVFEPRPIDLNGVVRDTERILERLIGERVVLRTVLAPGLGRVVADPGQIQQVILNLAINARDAMPGGGTITIETADVPRAAGDDAGAVGAGSGAWVRLLVGDTGVGMDEATRAQAFEPFFTTKPPGKGTGLGLSTVRSIVEQAGGRIDVTSRPGQGSRFELLFPRGPEVREERAPAERPVTDVLPSGEVILVVEDDDQVRRVTVRTLERAGFVVLSGSSLEEALERVERHPVKPVVLLADVRMPSRSGPEVSAALTARVPGLRTVYMSGYSSEDLGEEKAFPPGTAVVQKPFTMEALVARIREAIGR